ncbi:hypothetical protein TKWG_15640 [Advenella kashmirensis WT001]|uniref:Xcc1710-like domain-containing protein n=1 Tax=Advenella kashmirensis (strain DSM 17095 / LMG 22695 / WT001) TaxID=1036672 RepID=I3UDM9_ADVKW|nr:MTH938/NDUFAF3 family protein [Advenella kashmirensis]AFK63117.1 hypothetical protein TKWG_15640 [Advenella kashmirensis WT001]
MELKREQPTALNTVTRYGDHFIEVNEVKYTHAIAFRPEGAVRPWNVTAVSDITTDQLILAADIRKVEGSAIDFLDDAPTTKFENTPEILLVGTGTHQHFLPAAVTAPLLAARVGIEAMDSKAAARTYNVLMAEGRNVAVALMLSEGE